LIFQVFYYLNIQIKYINYWKLEDFSQFLGLAARTFLTKNYFSCSFM